MVPIQRITRSKGYVPTHYHPHWDDTDRDLTWWEWGFIILLLMAAWGIYWCVIHWVDHWVGDWLSWYWELLSPITAVPVMWLGSRYGHNPLHWWPMAWGHSVLLDAHNADLVMMDPQEIVDSMGGPLRVWCDIREQGEVYLKFRRRKDAVWFGLIPIFGSQKKKKKQR